MTEATVDSLLEKLRSFHNSDAADAMKQFGISGSDVWGISVSQLRSLAKEIEPNHQMALELWDSKVHEARILASMLDEPHLVTDDQLNKWTNDIDSWDLCDQCCMNLFVNVPGISDKIPTWSMSTETYIKRTAFSLIAVLAVRAKTWTDRDFEQLLGCVSNGWNDERIHVSKSVSWALRQVGKRNSTLHAHVIAVGLEMLQSPDKVTQTIAKQVLADLRKPQTIARLRRKSQSRSSR